jgi:hypothetical protein
MRIRDRAKSTEAADRDRAALDPVTDAQRIRAGQRGRLKVLDTCQLLSAAPPRSSWPCSCSWSCCSSACTAGTGPSAPAPPTAACSCRTWTSTASAATDPRAPGISYPPRECRGFVLSRRARTRSNRPVVVLEHDRIGLALDAFEGVETGPQAPVPDALKLPEIRWLLPPGNRPQLSCSDPDARSRRCRPRRPGARQPCSAPCTAGWACRCRAGSPGSCAPR